MAGLAAVLNLDANGLIASAKLVYLNVGDGPVEAAQAEASLTGKKPDAAAFKEAARIASENDIAPFGNVHATAEYQRHLSRVLTERALAKAYERTRTK
jgi:carbon-monoxide dehydrogenase medium subunit